MISSRTRTALYLLSTGIVLTATAVGAAVFHRQWQHHRRRKAAHHPSNRLLAFQADALPPELRRLMVRCTNGHFVGTDEGEGVVAYRGIPYAAPPVGSLRWKAPQPAPPDGRVFAAREFGAMACQTERDREAASFFPQSESCLFLNVWCNARNPSTDKTVMVFLHGGSYAWGGTANPLYDGCRIVTEHNDLVVVTVGYRLGLWGFLDCTEVPGGEDYPDAPVLGLLDQIEALRWVRDNIAAFGGSPARVTLVGESAGAGCASLLATMPAARGLFRRVIAQSGSVALSSAPEEGRAFTQRLLRKTGCRTMTELVQLPTSELRRANQWLAFSAPFPQRDGRHLATDPYAAFAQGQTAHCDLLIGTNTDEVRYWMLEVGGYPIYRFLMPLLFHRQRRTLDDSDYARIDAFFAQSETDAVWRQTAFYNELLFHLPALHQAALHSEAGGRAFVYRWNFPSSAERLGACHAAELASVFGNEAAAFVPPGEAERAWSSTVRTMWVNFARCGDPSLPHLPWPRYTLPERPTFIFDAPPHITNDPDTLTRQLLSPLLRHHIGNVDWAL